MIVFVVPTSDDVMRMCVVLLESRWRSVRSCETKTTLPSERQTWGCEHWYAELGTTKENATKKRFLRKNAILVAFWSVHLPILRSTVFRVVQGPYKHVKDSHNLKIKHSPRWCNRNVVVLWSFALENALLHEDKQCLINFHPTNSSWSMMFAILCCVGTDGVK